MTVNQGKVIESLEAICKVINRDEFIYQFLGAYDTAKTTLTRLRDGSRNIGINGDVGYKKNLYFRIVPAGTDVYQATEQLKSESAIASNQIRFVMVTDFDSLVAFDLKADETLDTDIRLLDKQYAFFLPLIPGYEKAIIYSEHPADIKASEKMGQLFDLIRERNDLSKPEDIHALNVFLTRLLFCFYAEDTGIFQQDQMTKAIESTTSITGEDMDQFFTDLFAALNLPDFSPEKKNLATHFQAFPFVNGGLFRDDEPIPEFSTKVRRILLECGSLSWAEINPDIFGSMFQAVIDQEQRGNLGQHYTSVSNIMKVIKPLFLDKLWDSLEQAKGKEKKLKELLIRLQNIRVFDPACGSGNFLIISYKALRRLEMAVIDALNDASPNSEIYYSGIRFSQFYGIEIDDFAHEVAILSLWLAGHQMNLEFKDKFGYADATLPLKESGKIMAGNALHLDWKKICPPIDERGKQLEIYICSNPPFVGARTQTTQHKRDMEFIFGGGNDYKDCDYVSCWIIKASQYLEQHNSLFAGLVITNSVCQGEQVSLVWNRVFDRNIDIFYAYTPFPWSNNARSNAGVTCSIVGLRNSAVSEPKYIFSGDYKRLVKNINPYLASGQNVIVSPRKRPFLSVLPNMVMGNMPRDGGHLIITDSEHSDYISRYPASAPLYRPLYGAQELINGYPRWAIWIEDNLLPLAESIEPIRDRINLVKRFRLDSKAKTTNQYASIPHKFAQRTCYGHASIFIPSVSSERRLYIPMRVFNEGTISTNANMVIPIEDLYLLGILTSEMHNDWMRAVAGRLESRYRYSATLVYNTFPWPEVTEAQKTEIEALAEEILMVREDHPDKTLADLYDPDKMPAPLLEAHRALDRAVEKLYRSKPFADASERLEHLFGLYEQLIAKERKKGA